MVATTVIYKKKEKDNKWKKHRAYEFETEREAIDEYEKLYFIYTAEKGYDTKEVKYNQVILKKGNQYIMIKVIPKKIELQILEQDNENKDLLTLKEKRIFNSYYKMMKWLFKRNNSWKITLMLEDIDKDWIWAEKIELKGDEDE